MEIDFERIMVEESFKMIKWEFNVPAAPHMGGSWERLIRSVKSALKVMTPPHVTPSPEVLQSALIEVEYILNSRPLTYIPMDPNNEEAITPNHVLLGQRGENVALGSPTHDDSVVKGQWRLSQKMAQRFWHRWISEYRPTLVRRSKWFDQVRELREGDVVIVVDETDRSRRFPKGKVLQVHCGPDGHCRSATIQTQTGIYKRPASKLAILDVVRSESSPEDHAEGSC